jgi:hypothetical protein
LVPASKLYKTEDGNVATMLHKDFIKNAPRIHGDVPMTTECEQYYGADA